MPERPFAISPLSAAVDLTSASTGEALFTVSNALGQPTRVRLSVRANPEVAKWLSLDGPLERELASDGTLQVRVKIVIPAGTSPGRNALSLVVAKNDQPEEVYAVGPEVGFSFGAVAAAPSAKWWLWVVIAAAVVLLAGGAWAMFGMHGPVDEVPPPVKFPPDAGTVAKPQIAFNDLCPELSRGGQAAFRQAFAAECAEPVTDDDLAHLSMFSFPSPSDPIPGTVIAPLFACGGDAGVGADLHSLSQSIAAGRVAYDGEKAFQCRKLGRSRKYALLEITEPIAICEEVFTGLVAAGQPCDKHAECEGQAYCRASAATACSGTCTAKLALGRPCRPDRDICVYGAKCQASPTGENLCVLHGVPGARCTTMFDCRFGLDCTAGQCASKLGAGEVCTGPVCALGLACQLQTDGSKKCSRAAVEGEACSGDATDLARCDACLACDAQSSKCKAVNDESLTCDTQHQCPKNYFCDPSSRCRFRPRPGESCVLAADKPRARRGNCLYADAFCRPSAAGALEGICALMPTQGEPCGAAFNQFDTCRNPYHCSATGICAAAPGEGQPCATASTRCAVGLECHNNTCSRLPAAGAACLSGKCALDAWCGQGNVCEIKKNHGAPCATDGECSGACDEAEKVCFAQCGDTTTSSTVSCGGGCRNGARDVSYYLLFALLGLARLGRVRQASVKDS